MVDESHGISPGWPPLAFESLVAGTELVELLASAVYYGVGVPRGARQPVLLVPGFLSSDNSLALLAGWLRRLGYQPAEAGIALAMGSLPALLARVEQRALSLAGTGPLTIIGHSLGGLLARATAVAQPGLVHTVITLGSPLHADPGHIAHPLLQRLGETLLGGDRRGEVAALLAAPLPPGTRLTSLYTREDAVIDWRSCLDPDPRASNLCVAGSHSGLVWNAAVYRLLAAVLAS